MKMRKIIVAMLALVLVLSSLMTLVACGDKDNDKDKAIITLRRCLQAVCTTRRAEKRNGSLSKPKST